MKMKKSNALRVAVIGNGPQADLLGVLLQTQGHRVARFRSIRSYHADQPYYPNDLTTGIMKKFFTDSSIAVTSCKKIKGFHLEYSGMIFELPESFQAFEQYLYEHYSEEGEKLRLFMEDVRTVGCEWFHYIASGFTDAGCMKRSGRLFALTLEDAFVKYDIRTPSLLALFRLILPKPGVMFTVFCGYLYTQFFDVCALKEDVLEIIAARQMIVLVPSLNELSISTQTEAGDYDAVVDYRQPTTPPASDTTGAVVVGSFTTHECKLQTNVEYIVRMPFDECTVRLWNQCLLQMNGCKDNWHFELIYQGRLLPDALQRSRAWFEEFTGTTPEQFTFSPPETIDMYFDTSNANGYEWAFDKAHSMKDPTNLVRKHRKSILNPSYWGFAWFSAAYHAANIINNQMLRGNETYNIQW
ncbi:hypothetical protein [Ruminococcus sp.]|jgi:hypothetical protein